MSGKHWAIVIVVGIICYAGVMSLGYIYKSPTSDPIAQRIDEVTKDFNLNQDTKERLIKEILQQAKKDTVYIDTCKAEVKP